MGGKANALVRMIAHQLECDDDGQRLKERLGKP
jgi:hypothetical protein